MLEKQLIIQKNRYYINPKITSKALERDLKELSVKIFIGIQGGIPLVAILLKRQAKSAMKYMLSICQDDQMEQRSEDTKCEKKYMAFHLANCIGKKELKGMIS